MKRDLPFWYAAIVGRNSTTWLTTVLYERHRKIPYHVCLFGRKILYFQYGKERTTRNICTVQLESLFSVKKYKGSPAKTIQKYSIYIFQGRATVTMKHQNWIRNRMNILETNVHFASLDAKSITVQNQNLKVVLGKPTHSGHWLFFVCCISESLTYRTK